MLKISIKDNKTRRLLVLEGQIIAPWTKVLSEAACEDRATQLADSEFVIDLQGVTYISAEGEETLYRLIVQGAKFRGGGVFVKHVLKQLAQRGRQNNADD
jgi:hypothetical protein